MSRGQQRLPDYLGHILEAIERIDRYTEDMGELVFSQDTACEHSNTPIHDRLAAFQCTASELANWDCGVLDLFKVPPCVLPVPTIHGVRPFPKR